jgi:hypothetical protein
MIRTLSLVVATVVVTLGLTLAHPSASVYCNMEVSIVDEELIVACPVGQCPSGGSCTKVQEQSGTFIVTYCDCRLSEKLRVQHFRYCR